MNKNNYYKCFVLSSFLTLALSSCVKALSLTLACSTNTGGVFSCTSSTLNSSSTTSSSSSATVSATYTPGIVPISTASDIPNPFRGQDDWGTYVPYAAFGSSLQPKGWSVRDWYQRMAWSDLDITTKAQAAVGARSYNWSLLDALLAHAKSTNGRFITQFMPVSNQANGWTKNYGWTGGTNSLFAGAKTYLPDYVVDDMAAETGNAVTVSKSIYDSPAVYSYVVPDWNSQSYLNNIQILLQAIADRYGDDPTFGIFEVSGYGIWSEGHNNGFVTNPPNMTTASAEQLIQAHINAFPNQILIVNAQLPLLAVAMQASTTFGIAENCLGDYAFYGNGDWVLDDESAGLAPTRWKTAPFKTEWSQSSVTTLDDLFWIGQQQVSEYHISILSSANFDYNPVANKTGTPQATSFNEQTAFLMANATAGYRYALESLQLSLPASGSGSASISSVWVNNGVAPTYFPWNIVYTLKSSTLSVELPSALDLRTVLPSTPAFSYSVTTSLSPLTTILNSITASLITPSVYFDTVNIPYTLSPGNYTVSVRLDDAQGLTTRGIAAGVHFPAMYLANDLTRDTSGAYALGTITIPE